MIDKEQSIYECAKEIFREKGFKDTGVSDITQKAGMAVGSFYRYFPSKEKLFMDIFLEENSKLKQFCLQRLDYSKSPLEIISQMIVLNNEGMQSNPILREWYNRSVFEKIEKSYRDENGLEAVDFLYSSFLELVEKWQLEGTMRNDIDSRMIMMIFAAIINVDTHKEEIGLDYFPQLLTLMTTLIVQGLTESTKKSAIGSSTPIF